LNHELVPRFHEGFRNFVFEKGKKMKKVVVIGAGEFAQVAAVYLTDDSDYEVAAFAVDEAYRNSDMLLDQPVVSLENLRSTHPPDRFALFAAAGFSGLNSVRARLYQRGKDWGYSFITYVSSRAMVSSHVEIGENCFVFEGNVIQPFVSIGNNCILWSGNHIGHHSRIGDNCFITSHAVVSGNVNVGPYCFLGVNATIRDGVNIGPECVIGAGALILKDTQPQSIYRGLASKPASVRSTRLKKL
jgi:sugar O-acyltransferase (sialic acid O-acetyltransferase NeuD family)